MRQGLSRRAFLPLAGAMMIAPVAKAQGFPKRPISIVVPYPAGGSLDPVARTIAHELSVRQDWSVVVENMAGGAATIGTRYVARAEPDGHVLLLGSNQTHGSNPGLLKEVAYDPVRDFAPIAGIGDLQHLLVVRKGLGVANVRELIAYAQRQPGSLNGGSSGVGSASHLALELFKLRTGLKIVHVPYRGVGPLAQDLTGGQVDLAFATVAGVLGLVRSNDIQALAVASAQPSPALPQLPLLGAEGVASAEADGWIALFAPARTPIDVQSTLSEAVLAIVGDPKVAALIGASGVTIDARPPEALRTFVTAELSKWAGVIKDAGISME